MSYYAHETMRVKFLEAEKRKREKVFWISDVIAWNCSTCTFLYAYQFFRSKLSIQEYIECKRLTVFFRRSLISEMFYMVRFFLPYMGIVFVKIYFPKSHFCMLVLKSRISDIINKQALSSLPTWLWRGNWLKKWLFVSTSDEC